MMFQAKAIFLMVFGAAADATLPWLKPQFDNALIEKLAAPMLSLESQMNRQTMNTRRMQAIMSAECAEVCPGAPDMIKSMMEAATAETTPPPEGMNPAAVAMLAMCPHAETIICAGTGEGAKVCQDAEVSADDQAGMAMMSCACKCVGVASAQTDPSQLCGAQGLPCIKENADICGPVMTMMGGEKGADINCELMSSGCMEKMAAMATCDAAVAWGTGGCEDAAMAGTLADKKADCCEHAAGMVTCVTEACMSLIIQLQKVGADQGQPGQAEELAKSYEIGTVCETNTPKSDAEVSNLLNPTTPSPPPAPASSGGGGSDSGSDSASDFAAPPAVLLAFAASVFQMVANL